MRRLARRSITALQDIRQGETFNEDNLGLRRPGDGLSSKFTEYFLARKATRDISKGEQMKLGDCE
jgi:sialic acid synthase SpsE